MKKNSFAKNINRINQSNMYSLFRSYILIIFILLVVMFTLTSKIQQNLISSWMIENINTNLSHANEYVDNIIFSVPNNISKKILQHVFETPSFSYYFYSDIHNYLNTKYIQNYLRSLITSNNLIANISFYYGNNDYIISPLFTRNLASNTYQEEFSKSLKDSSYKEPFYWICVNSANIFTHSDYNVTLTSSSDVKYLNFIRKIPNVAFSTEYGGAIIISINENVFRNEIRNLFPQNTEVFLTTLDGTILLSSNENRALINLSSFGIRSGKIDTQLDHGNFIENINGISTLISYKKSAYSNYMYVSFSPINEITSNFSILRKLLAIVTLLTFVLGIVLSFYWAKVRSAPLLFLKNLCANTLNKYSHESSTSNEYEIINYTVDMLSSKLNEQEISIKEVSPLLLQHMFLSLVSRDSNTPDKINKIRTALRVAQINFDKEAYVIVIFKTTYDNSPLANNPSKSPEYINREIKELVKQFFMNKDIEYINAKINDNILYLFNFEPNYNINSIFTNILEHMSKFAGINTYIFISDVCYSMDNICTIFEHVNKIQNYSFIFPDKKIFQYNLLSDSKKECPLALEQYIDQMIGALKCHSWNNFYLLTDKLEDLVCSGDFSYRDIINELERLIDFIYNFSLEYNIIFDEVIESRSSFMQNASNICVFCDLLKHMVNHISNIFERRRNSKNHELIENVKKYVTLNISDNNISLETVSCHFGISSAHLSRIFKEISGMNFIDFVINQKLEYAMKKLLTTDLTVDSISKLVGYSNTQYFISKFKSKYGKTPNRFRLNIREIKLQDTEA